MDIKALNETRHERDSLATEMRALVDSFEDSPEKWGGNEDSKYKQMTRKLDLLDRNIKRVEDHNAEQRRIERATKHDQDEKAELRGLSIADVFERAMEITARPDLEATKRSGDYAKWDEDDGDRIVVNRAYSAAVDRILRTAPGAVGTLDQNIHALCQRVTKRALGTDVPASAGYLVPQGFRAEIIESQKAYGGIESTAGQTGGVTTLDTSTGNPLPFITYDGTDNKSVPVAENPSSEQTERTPVFAQTYLNAYTLQTAPVLVSVELAQDEAVNLQAFLARDLGINDARAAADWYAIGTGQSQPRGLSVAAPSSATTASNTQIEYSELIDLEHAVNPMYRNMGARFVMHDLMLKQCRSIKDDTGLPLWQPNIAATIPATIDGYPYTIDNSMPAPAAGAKSILFGYLGNFYIRRVMPPTLVRFDEYYMPTNQYGWKLLSRVDANLIINVANTTPVAALTLAA